MATLFERLAKGRPQPIEEPKQQSQKIQHAQKVLEWLQHWDGSTVCINDFRVYGPRPRDRKHAIESATILAEQGWLAPIPTRRHDSRAWQVVRKPTVFPTIAKQPNN
jgi:hypothetical protein